MCVGGTLLPLFLAVNYLLDDNNLIKLDGSWGYASEALQEEGLEKGTVHVGNYIITARRDGDILNILV